MDEPLSFEEVYRLHSAWLLRFCLTQVRHAADAEDIAADVFCSAFLAYGRTRPDPATVHVWLFRIARNKIIKHRRRVQFADRLLPRLGFAARDSAQVDDTIVLRDELRTALGAISQLRKRDRELVGLRVGGLDYREIGAMMGMSQRAAMVATQRAMAKLRKGQAPVEVTP